MSNIFDKIGDTKQAAEQWELSQDAVKHMCQQGKINARKFGNSWVVDLTQPNPSYVKELNDTAIQGIKKAVGEFNAWQGHAKVMFDQENGKVWTDIFESNNSWNEYHDKSVVQLLSKDGFYGRDDRTSMAEIKRLAEEQIKA